MKPPFSLLAIGLGLTGLATQAHAFDTTQTVRSGMTEIGDEELADMRGRYTEDDRTVAYFGVTMASAWTTASGQQLQSAMTINMDFATSTQPVVTFTPTVTIVKAVPPVPAPTPNPGATTVRSIDSSGLHNISGLVQGVQVAGDANVADNVTALRVREEGSDTPAASMPAAPNPGAALVSGPPQRVSARDGAAMASAQVDANGVGLLLSISGQGEVQQWIRSGSLGQTIALTSDGSNVRNTIELDLVRTNLAHSMGLNQDVVVSMNQIRGIGLGF